MATVPKIDSLAGIECYCTSFPGTGGGIKREPDGFVVSELVTDRLLRQLSETFSASNRYPVFTLEKRGLDSNHALFEIQRQSGLRLRVMGIKDAHAFTTQYAGSERPMKDPPGSIRTSHCTLALAGFARRPIDREWLAGNQFQIKVYGAGPGDLRGFEAELKKIGNFYGLQRFGSERLVTHLVGREIVKRNFAAAVDFLLSYTTEYDTPASREIRRQCADPANYRRLARTLPSGMDIERHVITALAEGRDAISALRAVPLVIRRLFVQAYQAFVFNKSLSRACIAGFDLNRGEPGDLCFEMEGPFTFGRVVRFENASGQTVPALRMAGSAFQPGRGRFDGITKSVLEEEGVSPRDFYVKEMQELSQQGGFRQAPLWCTEFERMPTSELEVRFKLPKGSYATTLLRELVKPADPIAAGF